MEVMNHYWIEFLAIATVHLFAVASPGPDFAVVLKHSVSHGRRVATVTSIGIAVGILVHVAYSLVGIGLLIKTTPWLFNALLLLASAYLCWIGIKALTSQGTSINNDVPVSGSSPLTLKKAFSIGFITNGINPKATLFFLSVFAVGVSSDTPLEIKVAYGAYMALATGIWFCGLSFLLGARQVRGFILAHGKWFDRIMGLALIGLALKLLFGHFV